MRMLPSPNHTIRPPMTRVRTFNVFAAVLVLYVGGVGRGVEQAHKQSFTKKDKKRRDGKEGHDKPRVPPSFV